MTAGPLALDEAQLVVAAPLSVNPERKAVGAGWLPLIYCFTNFWTIPLNCAR